MACCFYDDCERKLIGRADSRYCSNACRQRAHRYRKQLFAPYGGDPNRALAAALAGMARIIDGPTVTATGSASRNDSEV